MRLLYAALGCLMVVLGAIGAVLPLMPTTVFLILAAWFFARSSPRLEGWLLNHPLLGPPLRDWRENGAISLWGKAAACGGMAFGFCMFWLGVRPGLWGLLAAAAFLGACAAYVLTRPTAARKA